MSEISPQKSSGPLTIEAVLSGKKLLWGRKHPKEDLFVLWNKDRDYLYWASGAKSGKRPEPPMPKAQETLIRVAHMISAGEQSAAEDLYRDFSEWYQLAVEGEGLEKLPRPTPAKCKELLAKATIIGGHFDLDGIYSVAAAILKGGALGSIEPDLRATRVKLFRYNLRNIDEYTSLLGVNSKETAVVIDFAAHPNAALNLDHHTTCLSYWNLGAELPVGVFEPSMPSCPRLLANYCEMDIPEDVLTGCDMVDGARYPDLAAANSLSNPFVALEGMLSLDVSDIVARRVIFTLVANNLDPYSVINIPVWKARFNLLELELEEQRSYWSKPKAVRAEHPLISVADARFAPHPATRFRYLPFENPAALERPFMITVRGGTGLRVNLGISRNPFFGDKSFFEKHSVNLGGIAKTMGQGGGRQEAASLSIELAALKDTVNALIHNIDSIVSGKRN